MAVNFGLLQQAQAPGIQTFQVPNTSGQQEQGLLSGLSSMNESQRTASDVATQQLERDRLTKLLPGELAKQQSGLAVDAANIRQSDAETAGRGLLNKSAAIDLQMKQRAQKFQNSADAAYHAEISSSNDKEKAMTAYTNALSPEDQDKFQGVRDNHKREIAAGNAIQVSNAAGIVAAAQMDLAKGGNPDKMLPYINAQLDRVDPGHPALKTVEDLHNYSVVTVGTLVNPKVQAQLQIERQKLAPEITKLQQVAAEKKAEYGQMQDKNSPEAVDLKKEMDQVDTEIEGTMYGKGISGQLERSVMNTAAQPLKDLSGAASKAIGGAVYNALNPSSTKVPTFSNAQEANQWFANQPADVQADIKANPTKYGLK